MMQRRAFVAGLLGALSVRQAIAQERERTPRISYLVPGPPPCAMTRAGEAFAKSLSDYGYISGRNVRWDRRCFQSDSQVSELVTDVVRQAPDVIVVTGTRAALAAKAATTTIPIVFVGGDPMTFGLVSSLSKPGGNITGVTNIQVALTQKRLALLKDAAPALSRVAILLDPALETSARQWSEAEQAARTLQLNLIRLDARSAEEIETALRTLPGASAGLFVAGSQTFSAEYARIARLAVQRRLPTIMWHATHAHAGSLLSYGQSDVDLFRIAGNYVGKILKGANPADLPIEQATTFELVINLKTARALGITIPQSLLLRADEVIQ
jgi:ABC-type uncharacterized transport system substrate-binding protein